MKWVWAQKHSRKDPHASGNVQLPDRTTVSAQQSDGIPGLVIAKASPLCHLGPIPSGQAPEIFLHLP